MGRVLRTSQVVCDFDGIWDYIARDNSDAADRMIDLLNEQFELLASNPEIGELQPKLANGMYRRFTCRIYVIYYRPIEDGIVLVRVLHGARNPEGLL